MVPAGCRADQVGDRRALRAVGWDRPTGPLLREQVLDLDLLLLHRRLGGFGADLERLEDAPVVLPHGLPRVGIDAHLDHPGGAVNSGCGRSLSATDM